MDIGLILFSDEELAYVGSGAVLSGVNLKGAYILVHINSFRLGQTNSEYYIVWSRCVMV